ncbi:MAG TPA: methylated-DNA--[protein]-cysteine S-methyltransferase [Rubricoccaceae bacterium]
MTGRVLYDHEPSPLGPLLLTSDGEALTGVFMESHRHGPTVGADWVRDAAPFGAVREQLAAYFAGDLREFSLAVRPLGTPFQKAVWTALLGIPYGATESYGALARRLGDPGAVRAVGAANGRNPVSIVIPCHRVVGADGALTGYGGGMENKRRLLALESPQGGLFA